MPPGRAGTPRAPRRRRLGSGTSCVALLPTSVSGSHSSTSRAPREPFHLATCTRSQRFEHLHLIRREPAHQVDAGVVAQRVHLVVEPAPHLSRRLEEPHGELVTGPGGDGGRGPGGPEDPPRAAPPPAPPRG